ncbi:cyclodeaminase/cyclohydrolase family protein [Effusibacillus lacus]|uniref:Cyclodeaminase/cyclohydrolase domain-containing protein n=1 Tax=Effusibacillus lacus TaxID=1348429 RepID=A0A292YQH8_9BACL|nr:cyclodeaminase/cyclohydrolase family protein [Effusibacillus lacus]TCS76830.1 formiminotetrahydrofolate cyclodeaminase [Effusibacillus lacus]GAX91161.1 hypothetical protein EFBL_2827 [Effusibacillus lacus]
MEYKNCSLIDFCKEVGRPEIPSPAGGAVIGVVGALLASLTELIARVSIKHSACGGPPVWSAVADAAGELSENLLRFAEEDVQEAARLIRGEGPACVRKQIAAPAKIASSLVKVLRLMEGVADQAASSVRADVRVIAHLGRGAADAIYEIERTDIEWGGGGDEVLLERIEEWRIQAHEAACRILNKARDESWQK